jgi:hypothetical protein
MKPLGFTRIRYHERPGDADRRRALAASGLLLHGPLVPAEFESDGCSVPLPPWPRWLHKACEKVADGRWRQACRIHDFEYYLLRQTPPRGRVWKNRRYQADWNFRANIKLILRGECRGWAHRVAFFWVSRVYFRAVRAFGRRAATGKRWRN